MKEKAADDVGTEILQMNPKPASMSRFPGPAIFPGIWTPMATSAIWKTT
jgi:hypothetical protein